MPRTRKPGPAGPVKPADPPEYFNLTVRVGEDLPLPADLANALHGIARHLEAMASGFQPDRGPIRDLCGEIVGEWELA
jgi:hypothetical protein